MLNIGVDIAKISRFKDAKFSLIQKILSKQELIDYQNTSSEHQALFLARSWAIKEAIFKSDNSYSQFSKINLTKVNNKWTFNNFSISISHEDDFVIAMVVKNEDKYEENRN
ncbi:MULTISPECIES: holo-ACP synthase [unclassified Mycoplasma]|uniref:holo-ACP synthase n=1 Tax=unclassified Mycoplasma TaxID=2683645 RepID=UPI00211BDC57|nr:MULTISPECIES: 4'-phosphopantetheinyl transferase superfamily protein [unclassified Mycoplasma]UUM19943.1 4'-phosphopantetheinyl transferase superfamily protein [Mycoplasma sp. 1578d]UUM24924.1 4'-phosphopantetheinyl transferase superfamily protein [Mycoplasma sp. 3686d]